MGLGSPMGDTFQKKGISSGLEHNVALGIPRHEIFPVRDDFSLPGTPGATPGFKSVKSNLP